MRWPLYEGDHIPHRPFQPYQNGAGHDAVADAQLRYLRDIGDPTDIKVVETMPGLHLQAEAMGLSGRTITC